MDTSESIVVNEDGSNIDHAMSNDMMDLSNVRVLLCDTDVESCHEVLALLKKCCYQVIPVCSAADALDALNSQGHCIDIVLAEASLLISNGAKIFNFIKLDVNIKHIPVTMMLDEDEIPLVLKGLMLGATDYLVKPLSSNELMKLWTHTKRKGSQVWVEDSPKAMHLWRIRHVGRVRTT